MEIIGEIKYTRVLLYLLLVKFNTKGICHEKGRARAPGCYSYSFFHIIPRYKNSMFKSKSIKYKIVASSSSLSF